MSVVGSNDAKNTSGRAGQSSVTAYNGRLLFARRTRTDETNTKTTPFWTRSVDNVILLSRKRTPRDVHVYVYIHTRVHGILG